MHSLLKTERFFDRAHYVERECPICHTTKLICDIKDYVYKINKTVYCSYTCYRKAQKLREKLVARRNSPIR